MKKFRRIAIIMVLVMSVCFAWGCSANDSNDETSENSTSNGNNVATDNNSDESNGARSGMDGITGLEDGLGMDDINR